MAVKLSSTAAQVLQLFILYGLVFSSEIFPGDVLTPYTRRHGSRRYIRDASNCKHVSWDNETFEELKINSDHPSPSAKIQVHRFADSVRDTRLPRNLTRYLKHTVLGSIAYIDDPYYTLSVIEPGGKGGCTKTFFTATTRSVSETIATRPGSCKVAVNAGYFSVSDLTCLGNVVADGKIVQTNDEENVNFGIRQDGTIVVGYLSESDITNSTNPFRQLVTGVIWLVRNGTNYVNESMHLECASHEDTGKLDTFVNVLSARTAVGHDSQGRVVMVQVDGQTHKRGINLWQFADLLIAHGLVNAINLDGGGSSTFLHEGTLANYPSDHCWGTPQYRCERRVSTVLCAHEAQCLDPLCSEHGSCDNGHCSCDPPWIGETCDTLNCSETDCSNNGNCSEGVCSCEAGWTGSECNQTCSNMHYGPNCELSCYCYGRSYCDLVTGKCLCPPGYTGYSCWRECPTNTYGQDCLYNCTHPNCSGHGKCSPVNGTCLCDDGWMGVACNISLADELDGLLKGQKVNSTATQITPTLHLNISSPFALIRPSSTHYQTTTLKLASNTVSSGNSPNMTRPVANTVAASGNSRNKTSPGNSPGSQGDSPSSTEANVAAASGDSRNKTSTGNSPRSQGDSPSSVKANPPQRETQSGDSPSASTDQSDASSDTSPSAECATHSPKVAIGVTIGISLASVCIHVVLCLWTHRTLYRQLVDWYDRKIRPRTSKYPHRRRKRRRKRKQHFVPLAQDSSSDCSI